MAVGVLPPPHAVKPAIPNKATPSKTQCRFIYYTALLTRHKGTFICTYII